jgi:predicted lysophospholipase L1 biosynthesis ABC-type transport system permease subunit
MQTPTEGKNETPKQERKKLDRFLNFLKMGGFIVIIVAIIGIVFAIMLLSRGCSAG